MEGKEAVRDAEYVEGDCGYVGGELEMGGEAE